MTIYLSRLFRASGSCSVLGTTFQERSRPSEEALDRTPNINISKENITHERRLKKMGLLHLKNQQNKTKQLREGITKIFSYSKSCKKEEDYFFIALADKFE